MSRCCLGVQVGALDDLSVVHRKIEGLGGIHHRHGVHALEHMPVFQGVVVKLLSEALGPDLTDDVGEAWLWLWGWLTESMLAVEKSYGEKTSLIQQSWDVVNENLTTEEIGSAVYEALFEVRAALRATDFDVRSGFVMRRVIRRGRCQAVMVDTPFFDSPVTSDALFSVVLTVLRS